MAAGPIGPTWATGSWPDTTWQANTWSSTVPVLGFVLDLNTRLRVFLQDHFATPITDLTTLTTRYLRTLTGDWTARMRQLIKDATDAMT